MCNKHEDVLNEYGVNSFEEIVAEEQQATAGFQAMISEMTPIRLGSWTFYVRQIPERLASALSLLEAGPETAEDAYRINQLLLGLKRKTSVVAADDRGQEIDDYSAARRLFLQALKEREASLAGSLRKLLLEQGADW